MSNAVYPTLVGLGFPVKKAPNFNTVIHPAVSGKEARAAFMAYPLWTFKLTYDLLRSDSNNELQNLMGFFLARQGSFDSFLFTDTGQYSVTDQSIGTGDGATTQFQLVRSTNSVFSEPVMNTNVITNVKVAGNVTTAYTITANALITFNAAPTAAQTITWTGTYYNRVRFKQDASEFEQFMNLLWKNGSVELFGCPGNKVL